MMNSIFQAANFGHVPSGPFPPHNRPIPYEYVFLLLLNISNLLLENIYSLWHCLQLHWNPTVSRTTRSLWTTFASLSIHLSTLTTWSPRASWVLQAFFILLFFIIGLQQFNFYHEFLVWLKILLKHSKEWLEKKKKKQGVETNVPEQGHDPVRDLDQ